MTSSNPGEEEDLMTEDEATTLAPTPDILGSFKDDGSITEENSAVRDSVHSTMI